MDESLANPQLTLPNIYVWLTQAEATSVNAGIDMLLALANLELPARLLISDEACVWLAPSTSSTSLAGTAPDPHKRLGLLALYELEPILVQSDSAFSTTLEAEPCSRSQLQVALQHARHVIRY